MRNLKLIRLMLMVVFAVIIMPINSICAMGIDLNPRGSISIYHEFREKPIENTEFRLYKIADILEDETISIREEFKKYPIDFESFNSPDTWDTLSSTLKTYIEVDNIAANKSLVTNASGSLKFENLELGIYLVDGDKSYVDGEIVAANPALVSIPTKNNGNYIYDIEISTKNEGVEEEKTLDLSVQKEWFKDNENVRPVSIKVALYKNNEFYEEVTLSAENNWKHTWTNLSAKDNWSVVEVDVPDKYTVTYEKYTTSIKVKNTYTEVVGPSTDEDLPQTGSTWWLVCILLPVGLGLMLSGRALRGQKRNEK